MLRGRALVLVTGLAFVLVLLLVTHMRPVHSQDGAGLDAERQTFESPLIWMYPERNTTYLLEGAPSGDLLANGNMDQLGFYWRPPNHWIAGGWFEWFSTKPFNFPEYSDGCERNFIHTAPSSQRLQLYGDDYAAGLMQSVAVTPCTTYRFEAYGQSRPGSVNPPKVDVDSHMKVGIEPNGWMSGRSIYDYDSGLEPEEFPRTVVWSPEATHYFAFAPYSVTAEALSSTLTVVLYSTPEISPEKKIWWNDTIWDTASLVEVAPPSGTIMSGTQLPAPDGFISNVTVLALPHVAVIEWETAAPASSQVVYRIKELQAAVSVTLPYTYRVYLPLQMNGASDWPHYSELDSTPVSHHRVVLTDVPYAYRIEFAALSRRPDGDVCRTSASSPLHKTTSQGSDLVYVPLALGGKEQE
jgi:hypothetical protein